MGLILANGSGIGRISTPTDCEYAFYSQAANQRFAGMDKASLAINVFQHRVASLMPQGYPVNTPFTLDQAQASDPNRTVSMLYGFGPIFVKVNLWGEYTVMPKEFDSAVEDDGIDAPLIGNACSGSNTTPTQVSIDPAVGGYRPTGGGTQGAPKDGDTWLNSDGTVGQTFSAGAWRTAAAASSSSTLNISSTTAYFIGGAVLLLLIAMRR